MIQQGGTRRERRLARQQRRRHIAIAVLVTAAIIVVVVEIPAPARVSSQTRSAGTTSVSRGFAPAAATPGLIGTASTSDGVAAAWVTAENELPGTAGWQITGSQTPTGIMGYASLVQATEGQTLTLYVSTPATTFQVQAYRMGYYQGLGGRLVWQSNLVPGTTQPACPVTPVINMVSCDWQPSLTVPITAAWVQGQYLLKLVGSGGQQSYVPLTVWDPSSHATYVIMSGVLTDQAFNSFGGYDLYQGATQCDPDVYPCSSRSRVVSFDRPYAIGDGAGSYLSLVYPLTRLAEENGLDVTYWTDITLADDGNLLTNHKVLISPGHDEEWSLQMRQATQTAADHGVNLIFFGASPILRKVRLQSSPLGPDREMVNYRDPQADPLYGIDDADVTQNEWGQQPADSSESLLVGADYIGYYNSGSFPLVVSESDSWLFAGTGLSEGSEVPGVLNGDFQAYDPGLGGTPPNVEILAHSPVTVTDHPDRDYADTTYYTVPSSGAGVFSSGTVGWIPSLQECNPAPGNCPAPLMQQISVNLLRVFGAGPVGLTHPSVTNTESYY